MMLGLTAATWYIRRRRLFDDFHMLEASGDAGDEAAPMTRGPILMASMHDGAPPLRPVVQTVKDRLSNFVPGMAPSHGFERRDMLADEDSRQFGAGPWYAARRDASTGSAVSGRRPTLDRIYDSLTSMRSAGGAVLDYAAGVATAGTRSVRSREPSTNSKASAWQTQEKHASFDPYSDAAGLVRYSAPGIPASRPRGGRQASSYSYKDPFQEHEVESLDSGEIAYHDDPEDDIGRAYPRIHDPPPLTKLPSHATLDLTRLTPLSENPSIPTLTDPFSDSSASLNAPSFSPLAASGGASSTSSHEPHSPTSTKRPSSIAGADTAGAQYMRRSPSWWSRFAKAPILERALSVERKTPKPLEIRDPHPPPRLVTIDESMHSASPDSPQGDGGHRQRHSLHHGRSATSLQTAQTADTDTMERMADTMQIIQKDSSSSRGDASRGPSGDDAAAGHTDTARAQHGPSSSRPLSVLTGNSLPEADELSALVQSPVEMTLEDSYTQPLSDMGSPRKRSPGRLSPGSKVAERIQAYERRMSQNQDDSPRSPTAASPRARRPSGYGLAPKPSLYVANPDDRYGTSSSS